MVRKPDIQYIQQFYVHGSEAKAVEIKPAKKKAKTKLPKPKPVVEQCTKIYIDPVAACGLLVAAVMLVVMVIGIFQFRAACEANAVMEDYVAQLEERNETLRSEYLEGVDLEKIREKALAVGMVPVEENPPVTIRVNVPQPEPEPSAWDDFIWFLKGLFA